MRNWWLFVGVLVPLMGCGMTDEEESESEEEDQADVEEEEESGDLSMAVDLCDGVDFGTLRGSGGGIRSAQSASDDPIAALMPSSVEMLMVIQDVETITTEYRDFLDPSRAGDHQLGNQLREFQTTVQDRLGIDIANPDDWKKTGLDFKRPWAFGFHTIDLNNEPPMSVAIPLADRGVFDKTINSLLASKGTSLDCGAAGDGQRCGVSGDAEKNMIFTGDYLVVVNGTNVKSADSMLSEFGNSSGNKLKDRERFVQIYDRIQSNWNALIWTSDAFSNEFVRDEMKASDVRDLEDLNRKHGSGDGTGLWGMGMTASLSLNHLELDMIGGADWLNMVSKYVSCKGQDRLASDLDGDAFAAIRISQNMPNLLEVMLDDEQRKADWEEQRSSLQSGLDVDIQNDFLLNLDGNISMVGVSEDQVGTLLYLGLIDEKKGAQVLETVMDEVGSKMKKEDVDGKAWYVLKEEGVELGISVSNSHLIVAMSPQAGFVQDTQNSLKESKGDLLTHFGDRGVRTLKEGAPYVALINIPGIVNAILEYPDLQAVLDLKPRDLKHIRRARQLVKTCAGDAMVAGGMNGNAMMGVARLESGSGDFGPCLELALEQQ